MTTRATTAALLGLLGLGGALLVLELWTRQGLESRLVSFEERVAATEAASRSLTQRVEALQARLENRRVVDESFATRLRDLRGQVGAREKESRPAVPPGADRVDRLAAGLESLEREVQALAEAFDALEAQQAAPPGEGEPRAADSTTGAVFSPDGRQVMTTDGKTVRIWDAATGEEVTPAPEPQE